MLSIVIPLMDEAEGLGTLYGELDEVVRRHGYDVEIVFVDDGSTDDSWAKVQALAAADPRVCGIRFRRNFGKAAALSAGFQQARGGLVMTLDADLQDDPAEIPRFLAEIEKGRDVVSGWKRTRHDPWNKVVASRLFNWLVSWMTGVKLHDHNCGMKCYRHEVIREVRLYGELHRFVPVLAAARGFSVGELVIAHRPRRFGRSKYGVERIGKGFLDLLTVKFLTGFTHRPQHLLGGIGLTAFVLGVLGLTYLAGFWVISRLIEGMEHIHLHQRAALYYSLALLMIGGHFMSFGFLGELITAYQGRDSDVYSIAETTPRPRDLSSMDAP